MNDSTETNDIDLKQIVIPEDIKRSIDWKTEKNTVFLDSFHRRQINPINVRPLKNGHYEIVCGMRRHAAAKKLGHKTIVAKVENWTDNEIGYLRMVENVHRIQLTPAREALANQKLLAAFEVMFGRDPHRGGNTNISIRDKQTRVNGKFGALAETTDTAQNGDDGDFDDTTDMPLTVGATVAPTVEGSPQPEGKTQDKAFTELLSDVTGKTLRMSQIDKAIAEAFSPEELDVLSRCDVTKRQLYKLSRVQPPEERSAVTCMIAMGQKFEEAIATVKAEPAIVESRKEYLSETKMTDAQWLEHYCGKIRGQLQNPIPFDEDAIVCRKLKSARQVFRKDGADIVLEVRAKRYRPATDIFHKAMHMEHPGDWLLCPDCMGKNLDKPECRGCLGHGYRVQFHSAKMVKAKK